MKMLTEAKPRSFLLVILTIAAASSVSMLGGLALESVVDKLIPLVPLIIALPALNTMVGDYATIIASFEELDITNRTESKLVKAIIKSTVINIVCVIILSLIIAKIRKYPINSQFFIKYAIFVCMAICLTVLAIWIITKLLDRILNKTSMSKEDVLIPVITSVSDVLMLVLISISAVTIFV